MSSISEKIFKIITNGSSDQESIGNFLMKPLNFETIIIEQTQKLKIDFNNLEP